MSGVPKRSEGERILRNRIGWTAIALAIGMTVITGLALGAEEESPDPASLPDLFVIMIDDHGYIADERVLERLPAIHERFVTGGLRFEQAYDETPLCCPARATVLTGRSTLHHGVLANDGDDLDASVSLATVLDDAGYHTIMSGKYLTSYSGPKVPPGWDRVAMRKDLYLPSYWIDGEVIELPGQHTDEVTARMAVEMLREAPLDAPVFAYVTPSAPHREQCKGQGKSDEVRECDYFPSVVDRDLGAEVCAGIPDHKPPDYAIAEDGKRAPWGMPDWPDGWPLGRICESLLVVDRMVADLVEIQAQRGRPAWFVFLSDNGMSWGRKSYPLKHVPTSTRLPFYVAGPGIAPGSTDVLISNIDLAPTLTDLAGTEIPDADGASFRPLLEGSAFEGRSEVLEIMPSNDRRAYDGWEGLRTPDWRYIRWQDGRQELYDLAADPDELVDLVGERPDRVASMRERLDALVAESRS